MRRKWKVLLVATPILLLLDIVTKRWAVEALPGAPRPDFMGGFVPLTLAFNRGAAFGISIGDDPRWVFIPAALLALALMITLLVRADDRDHLRLAALTLVISGAIGNLIDRIRWDQGVVDFIGPVSLGFMDWPIFNVADMAISCGAVLLGVSFWQEDRALKRAAEAQVQEESGGKTAEAAAGP